MDIHPTLSAVEDMLGMPLFSTSPTEDEGNRRFLEILQNTDIAEGGRLILPGVIAGAAAGDPAMATLLDRHLCDPTITMFVMPIPHYAEVGGTDRPIRWSVAQTDLRDPTVPQAVSYVPMTESEEGLSVVRATETLLHPMMMSLLAARPWLNAQDFVTLKEYSPADMSAADSLTTMVEVARHLLWREPEDNMPMSLDADALPWDVIDVAMEDFDPLLFLDTPGPQPLGDQEWLGDEHITAGLVLIEQVLAQAGDRDVLLMRPAEVQMLVQGPAADRRLAQQHFLREVFSNGHDAVFLPLNDGTPQGDGLHWSLLRLQRMQEPPLPDGSVPLLYKAFHFDPAGQDSPVAQTHRQLAMDMTRALYLTESDLVFCQATPQANGYQCGDHVLALISSQVQSRIDGVPFDPDQGGLIQPPEREVVQAQLQPRVDAVPELSQDIEAVPDVVQTPPAASPAADDAEPAQVSDALATAQRHLPEGATRINGYPKLTEQHHAVLKSALDQQFGSLHEVLSNRGFDEADDKSQKDILLRLAREVTEFLYPAHYTSDINSRYRVSPTCLDEMFKTDAPSDRLKVSSKVNSNPRLLNGKYVPEELKAVDDVLRRKILSDPGINISNGEHWAVGGFKKNEIINQFLIELKDGKHPQVKYTVRPPTDEERSLGYAQLKASDLGVILGKIAYGAVNKEAHAELWDFVAPIGANQPDAVAEQIKGAFVRQENESSEDYVQRIFVGIDGDPSFPRHDVSWRLSDATIRTIIDDNSVSDNVIRTNAAYRGMVYQEDGVLRARIEGNAERFISQELKKLSHMNLYKKMDAVMKSADSRDLETKLMVPIKKMDVAISLGRGLSARYRAV